jgi:hypothetical protein
VAVGVNRKLMASKRVKKKKKFTIDFKLTISGMLGLGIVIFCVFLWMFLFGVWAGQTVLLPSSDFVSSIRESVESSGVEGSSGAISLKNGPKKSGAARADTEQSQADSEPSFFSLQVATSPNKEQARNAVFKWRARGYEAFFLVPDNTSAFYRVLIGKYESLADANSRAAILEENERIQAFITLLPASEIH